MRKLRISKLSSCNTLNLAIYDKLRSVAILLVNLFTDSIILFSLMRRGNHITDTCCSMERSYVIKALFSTSGSFEKNQVSLSISSGNKNVSGRRTVPGELVTGESRRRRAIRGDLVSGISGRRTVP